MQPVSRRYPQWAARGAAGRSRIVHTFIYLTRKTRKTRIPYLSRCGKCRQKKWFQRIYLDDAEYAIIALDGRAVALSAVRQSAPPD